MRARGQEFQQDVRLSARRQARRRELPLGFFQPGALLWRIARQLELEKQGLRRLHSIDRQPGNGW